MKLHEIRSFRPYSLLCLAVDIFFISECQRLTTGPTFGDMDRFCLISFSLASHHSSNGLNDFSEKTPLQEYVSFCFFVISVIATMRWLGWPST